MSGLEAEIAETMEEARRQAARYSSGDPGRTGLMHLVGGVEESLLALARAIDEMRASETSRSDRPGA